MSANFSANSIAPVPENVPEQSWPSWFVMIARAVNWLIRRSTATTLTLTASATSTTLTDDRIGPVSHISLTPLTSSATAIDIAPYVSARNSGTATISHGSSTATDLNFSVKID